MIGPTPYGLGAMMLGGKIEGASRTGSIRQKNDFYPTPEEATQALLNAEGRYLRIASRGRVWEPACGDGRLAKVLEANGFKVVGTDLVYRGYGTGRRDFFRERKPLARAAVTNPPFEKDTIVEFIQHALDLCPDYVAMFLKATFFHAKGRKALFDACPPAMIYPLTWRPDFLGLDKPALECSWYVWRRAYPADRLGSSSYRPLLRGRTL